MKIGFSFVTSRRFGGYAPISSKVAGVMHSNRDGHKAFCPDCGREYPPERQTCPEDGTTLFSYDASDSIEREGDPLIGETFDERFHVEDMLGSGGMARVYRGVQLGIERDVAIKVLHPNLAENETFIKRFLREARVISDFKHPNIVRLIDFGQEPDHQVLYLVMEMIEGIHLDDLLSEGRLASALATEIVVQVCSALSEAHAADVVHRDLKPTNIMLVPRADGRFQVKIIDFGIADALQHSAQLTQTGAICGTPRYMAPEQVLTETVDPRADIYSLGALLFEMLSGRPVFRADRDVAMALRHARDSAPSLAECVSPDAVPESLVALTDDMLIKDREARPQSILEVRDRLVEMRRESRLAPIHLEPGASLESAFDEWIEADVPEPTSPESSGFTEGRDTGPPDDMPQTGERGLDPEAILGDGGEASDASIDRIISTPDYGEREETPSPPSTSSVDETFEAGLETEGTSEESTPDAESTDATMEFDKADFAFGEGETSSSSEQEPPTSSASSPAEPSRVHEERDESPTAPPTPDDPEADVETATDERAWPDEVDERIEAEPFFSEEAEGDLDRERPNPDGSLEPPTEESDIPAGGGDSARPPPTPDDASSHGDASPDLDSSASSESLAPIDDSEVETTEGDATTSEEIIGGNHRSEGRLDPPEDSFEGEAPTEVWDPDSNVSDSSASSDVEFASDIESASSGASSASHSLDSEVDESGTSNAARGNSGRSLTPPGDASGSLSPTEPRDVPSIENPTTSTGHESESTSPHGSPSSSSDRAFDGTDGDARSKAIDDSGEANPTSPPSRPSRQDSTTREPTHDASAESDHPLPPSPHGGDDESEAESSRRPLARPSSNSNEEPSPSPESEASDDDELPAWLLALVALSPIGFIVALVFFYFS